MGVPAPPLRTLHHVPHHDVFESEEEGEEDGVDPDGCVVGPSYDGVVSVGGVGYSQGERGEIAFLLGGQLGRRGGGGGGGGPVGKGPVWKRA